VVVNPSYYQLLPLPYSSLREEVRPMGAKIGALWKNKSKDGNKPFLSGLIDTGLLGRIRVAVFKNELKEKNEQPDYHILLSDPPEKQLEDVPF